MAILFTALVPVAFLIILGYYAGRKKLVSADGARNFSTYIVNFALPCSLFIGIFSFTAAQFENVPYLLTITLALIVPFLIGMGISFLAFKKSSSESSLFACNCGFPDMAYFGLPVLTTILGPQGMLPIIVGNLVTSILILPCAVIMLNRGKASLDGKAPLSFLGTLDSTIKQPIVWAPILGLILMLIGFKPPVLLNDSLKLIGNTTGGVALFTLGVMLSFLKLQIKLATIIELLLKNMFMPTFALVLALLFHLDGTLAKGAIILAACPAATIGAMLSAKFQVSQDTAPTEILASNVFGMASMAFWIFVAEKIW